jgi:hypothetical protein
MTKEAKVEVELHDEDINDIVEETLEEETVEEAAELLDKGKDEDESEKKVKDAENAVKKQAPAPKTKAGMISAMTNKMLKMSKLDMEGMYASYHKEDADMDKSDAIVETQIDTSAELDALVESEATLSDEFKAKTAVIFEAAVKSKLSEEIDRIESQYKEELAEEVSSTKAELVEKVDSYLNYVVETWMTDNQVAIQNGLRAEIAETFMEKLKGVFVESYIDVPESKVDLVDELAENVEELETKLNETTQKVIDTTVELEDYKRESIIREHARDLADTQVEKLKGLVENVDFESEEQFSNKVKTIKESYFAKEVVETSDDTILENTDADANLVLSSSMERYVSAVRKISPKK